MGDAGVVRLPGSVKAVACATDGNGRWCELDPAEGTRRVVAEAFRNVACVGARPLATTNCLNFGDPERPEIMWQLAESIAALGEATRALDVPVTGGNVSLYNQTRGRAIHPTPVVGILGLLEDAEPTRSTSRSRTRATWCSSSARPPSPGWPAPSCSATSTHPSVASSRRSTSSSRRRLAEVLHARRTRGLAALGARRRDGRAAGDAGRVRVAGDIGVDVSLDRGGPRGQRRRPVARPAAVQRVAGTRRGHRPAAARPRPRPAVRGRVRPAHRHRHGRRGAARDPRPRRRRASTRSGWRPSAGSRRCSTADPPARVTCGRDLG